MNIYDLIRPNHSDEVVQSVTPKRGFTQEEYEDLFGLVKEINLRVKHIHELDIKEALEKIAQRLQEED